MRYLSQNGGEAVEDFRDLMERVKESGELRVIKGANWDLELGAAAYFGAKARNPSALLFSSVG